MTGTLAFSSFIAERAEFALGEYCELFGYDFDEAYATINSEPALAIDIVRQVFGVATPLVDDMTTYLVTASREYV